MVGVHIWEVMCLNEWIRSRKNHLPQLEDGFVDFSYMRWLGRRIRSELGRQGHRFLLNSLILFP